MTFKLYYSKMSCGEQVDLFTKKTESGIVFKTIYPKGTVTAGVLPSGKILNENAATLTFMADQCPSSKLSTKQRSLERYEYLNAFGFVNSELHPALGKLFNSALDESSREKLRPSAVANIERFFDLVVAGKYFVMDGDAPNAVEIYACFVLSWSDDVGVDLSCVPEERLYSRRVQAFPGVKEAHDKMQGATATPNGFQF